MHGAQNGLRSTSNEGTLAGGERQARAAFALASRDPTLRRLILLEILALTGLWVLFFLVGRKAGTFDRESDRIFVALLYLTAASALTTGFSVAFAFAVDAAIDGLGGDLRIAFGEVRRRLPVAISWWLASTGGATALSLGARAVMRPIPALLLVTVLWEIASFFVVPAIVLEDGGPARALRESLRLLRARWGRALAGLFVIGFLAGIGCLACGVLLRATAEAHPRITDEAVWRFLIPLIALYFLYGVTAATRGGFAMILARDALDDLPGEPPPIKPRSSRGTIAKRVVLGVLAVALGLLVIGVLFGHHSRGSQSPIPRTSVISDPSPEPLVVEQGELLVGIEDPAAAELHPGAPLVLHGETVGRIQRVLRQYQPTQVSYRADPRRVGIVVRSRMKVATRGGEAYLLVIPHRRARRRDGGPEGP